MNPNERFEELWTDYLEGETSEPLIAELLQLLAQNSELREQALRSYQLHRMLGLLAGTAGAGAEVARRDEGKSPVARRSSQRNRAPANAVAHVDRLGSGRD